MRSLTPEAQEERRRQVIGLRESGLTYEAIGLQVGLTRNGKNHVRRTSSPSLTFDLRPSTFDPSGQAVLPRRAAR